MLILQWDHSKLSTYKSPHTSSIWGVTWNRWSHSSICNKNDANNIFSGCFKIGFLFKNEIEGQCQSSPKLSGILRVLRCICGPNLEILSWIGGEWWHGQTQNMAIFYFEVKFDLEIQGQLTPKTIGILTKVFRSSGPNLVILAWTGDKLSRGQASDYRTHRRTHRQTQATTIPEGQNWPRVKMTINMANADYLFLWNELEPRCQQRAAGSLESWLQSTLLHISIRLQQISKYLDDTCSKRPALLITVGNT